MGPGDSVFGDPHPVGTLSLSRLDVDILGLMTSYNLGFEDLACAGGSRTLGDQLGLVGCAKGFPFGEMEFGSVLSMLPESDFSLSSPYCSGDLPGMVNGGKGILPHR